MPEILFRAMNAAVGNQDVAVIVLPGDVAVMETEIDELPSMASPLAYLISFHNVKISKKWLLI